jgi:hypothetical protein
MGSLPIAFEGISVAALTCSTTEALTTIEKQKGQRRLVFVNVVESAQRNGNASAMQ